MMQDIVWSPILVITPANRLNLSEKHKHVASESMANFLI